MKLFMMIMSISVLSVCSCSREAQSAPSSSSRRNAGVGRTVAVPSEYFHPAKERGSVERLDYQADDPLRGGRVRKTVYVYLPYGYGDNPETRYDILYLMHGWGGRAGEYFGHEGGTIRNMFDIMMEKKEMKPTIIVSATFYHQDSPRDFGNSVKALREFHKEFLEELMPAVEGKYRTYAQETTKEAFAASRDHRAFGGFSLGSVTTWMEFCYDADYIRYFLPMSGSCWYYGGYGDYHPAETCDFFEKLIKKKDLNKRGYFIYVATGTQDAVRDQVDIQMEEMLKRRNVFPEKNVVYVMKDGGRHDFKAVREYLYNALPCFFRDGGTDAVPKEPSGTPHAFTEKTMVREVVEAPEFDGFGKLLFPVDKGYWGGSTLGELRLTWYSEIRPESTVAVVNRLRADAAGGRKVFYPVYTEQEMERDPHKRDTGLFFFRGKPGGRTAFCNAGGGFAFVGAMHDSFPHALKLSEHGVNAFALIYRPGARTACEDLARAIRFVFEHAEELAVNMDGYSLWGGSAGARMAAWLGSYGTEEFGERKLPRPAAVVMQYTGLSEWRKSDPPTYAVCGDHDGIASWRGMEQRLKQMSKAGIPTKFRLAKGLGHGFGLGIGTSAEGWLDEALAFWMEQLPK